MDEELAGLRADTRALEERLQALEEAVPAAKEQPPAPLDGDALWALTGLQSRLAEQPSTADGAVMLVGSLTLPTGEPVVWQQGTGTSAQLETDWSDHAATFAALGHPVRIELLRSILSGVHATADLAETGELGTTGQLHHHLRQLVAAGWVRQSGRGTYEIPAARVVPLLACMLGAQR